MFIVSLSLAGFLKRWLRIFGHFRRNDAQTKVFMTLISLKITRKIKEKGIEGKGESGREKQTGHTHNF